ncbi:TPA: hypothetical protein N2G45_002874 [Salmonella enterica]|nr:hypothetical protein [Salmonella enterica]HCL5283969.1 hypothetical protein [Salmonella enterica]
MTRNKEIATTILNQLGGNRFIVMTGARQFVAVENGLQLDLPRKAHFVKNGINRIVIRLNGSDLYDLTAMRIVTRNSIPTVSTVSEHTDLYCDMLQDTFTDITGLNTHL